MAIDIGGTTRATGAGGLGQYGAIDTATALLDGALVVNFVDAFVPTAGDSFSVIGFGSRVGQFGTFDVFGLAAGLAIVPVYEVDKLRLVVESATIPGDFDGDGDVDGEDFLLWQIGGSPDPLSSSDMADWEANYGAAATSFGAGAAVSVPEPSTIASALIVALCITCYRRRQAERKRHR